MNDATSRPLGLVQCTNDEYHRGGGISKSHLDAIANVSSLHYWDRYINPEREPFKPTAAMILGSAVHSAVLEPDLFPLEYVESPGFDKRTKNGKAGAEAFALQHPDKIVLTPHDYATCLAARDAIYRHPVASSLLRGGKSEQSFYAIDQETGELIKCRADYMHDSGAMIVDLKTTEDASEYGFGKSASNFRYPVQTAWYNGVFDAAFGDHPKDWVFLAVETKRPYAIGIYWAEQDQVDRGHIAARRDFLRIVEAKKSGNWDDYGIVPKALQLPAYSKF